MFDRFKKIIGQKELIKEQVGNYFYYGSCFWETSNNLKIIDSKKVETLFFLNTYATNSMRLIIESIKGKKEYHLEKLPEADDFNLILNVVDFDSNNNKLIVFLNKEVALFRIPNENMGFYFSNEKLIQEKDMCTSNIQNYNKENSTVLENERLRKFERLINKLITINPNFDIIRSNEEYAVLYCNSMRYNFTLKLSSESDGLLHFEYSANNYANSTHCNIVSENIFNFDKINDAFEFLESTIISRNNLFSIDYSPLKKFDIKSNVNLLSIKKNSNNQDELQLIFEYGIIIKVYFYYSDLQYGWKTIPENAFVEEDIINLVENSVELLYGDKIFSVEAKNILTKYSNKEFKLKAEFDKYRLFKIDSINLDNYETEFNIQGIESLKHLNKLIDKITSSNKNFKIVERDELGNILLELYSLQFKFSIRLKLNLSSGILKIHYNVYDFSGEHLRSLLKRTTVNEYELADLEDVNHSYDLLVRSILKANDLSNIDYNPFRSSLHKKSVKLLKISQKKSKQIELVFEYGIVVRFRAKNDYNDFDDPDNYENEIPYKYEVTPHNAILPDEIDELADHCYALIFDYYDQKEADRILRVNTDWEFKLNPNFSWD